MAYFRQVILFFLGKTTLADTLVASNGIISSRMAGKVNTNNNWHVQWKLSITATFGTAKGGLCRERLLWRMC